MGKHLVIHVDVVSGCINSIKLHALSRSVVHTGVTVMLGLCNPPRRGCGEPAKPGLLYPLVWIPCYGIVFVGVVKQSRLCNT
jgi:cytochrome c biogenesis protein CcdA